MMGFGILFSDTMIGSDSCITTVMDDGISDKIRKDSFAIFPISPNNIGFSEEFPNGDIPSILSTMLNGSGNDAEFPFWKLTPGEGAAGS